VSVVDPHDSLYPRASTRLGNKFQCTVPEWDPTTNSEIAPPGPRNYYQPKKSRASTPAGLIAPNGSKDKDKESDWSDEKDKSSGEKSDKEKEKEKEKARIKKSGECLSLYCR